MKSLWNDNEAQKFAHDPLQLRVYSSRLLGQEPDLVLHGGGNTSVKMTQTNLFGETEEVIYVKGSGWDLASIEAAGFAPVRLEVLRKMAGLKALSDTDMVRLQRSAMTDPRAPNPSVEAILHAVIPFRFVDHTHADAVVTLSNTPGGENRLRRIYGDRMLIIPYVMPGFVLAKQVYEATQNINWSDLEGMILLHHGVFTFADEARESYERMIRIVSAAEDNLYRESGGAQGVDTRARARESLAALASMRRTVSEIRGAPVIAKLDTDPASLAFARLPDVASIATRGPLTPDHVIRSKRIPVICGKHPAHDIEAYAGAYRDYFERHTDGALTCLDGAPRWAVWPEHGIVSFGASVREADIIADIKAHTIRAIRQAEALGGWEALPERDIFALEYWELEQAKLRKGGTAPEFQGRVALVSGAASGIGHACVEALHTRGAAVLALDINPDIESIFDCAGIAGRVCDVTDRDSVQAAVRAAVRTFGGLDILISNAGIFPASENIADMNPQTWKKSLAVNLTSHQILLQAAIPFLCLGISAAVVFVASKNVPAPGPGAGAYSVAKAGLTQLARVAALELAPEGVRVNTLHPNAVFDTGIWTPEVLEKRARHYGKSVEEYRTGTLLGVEVTSRDVAEAACTLAGAAFTKTTGAQIPVDGGNARVI